MVIFKDSSKQRTFEKGTSPTSIIVLKSQDGESVPADLIIESGEKITAVTLEVLHSNTGEVIIEEAEMDLVEDSDTTEENFDGDDFDEDEFAYFKTFNVPEDVDEGQYYLIHRATVGGNNYKRTAIINIVDVYEKYS